MSDLFAYNTRTLIKIEAHWCGSCNIPYGLPEGFLDERRRDHKTWTCPNGCQRHFPPGKSDEQKLKEAMARETALRDQLDAAATEAERLRGDLLRDRHRFANGVCPCCNRHFAEVQRHMATEHPDFDVETVAHKQAGFECSCGYEAETFRGLRIHQGKSRRPGWSKPDAPTWRSHLTVV